MTDALWQTTNDPDLLLKYPGGQASPRKRLLLACAWCRQVWDLLIDHRSRAAVEVAERFADGLADQPELDEARQQARAAEFGIDPTTKACLAARAVVAALKLGTAVYPNRAARTAAQWAREARAGDKEVKYQKQCAVARDIYRNPFRRVALEPAWLTPDVRALARAVYEARRFADLPVLADALEEAGCTDAEVIGHCRDAGGHVLGCWVVDLLVGKE